MKSFSDCIKGYGVDVRNEVHKNYSLEGQNEDETYA
jgi:hypothetical protein